MARTKNKKSKQFVDELMNNGEFNYEENPDILDTHSPSKFNKSTSNNLISSDIKIIAKNDSQTELIRSIKNNEITICSGGAGSGKTYVSLGMTLNYLRRSGNQYNKIYLVKSVVTLKDEEVGFLKGGLRDKIDPIMQSYYLNLEKLVNKETIEKMISEDILRLQPLAFIRGVTLDNCVIICDEMQNVTLKNAKTLMSRIGENCKLIMLGDPKQIDIKDPSQSSLDKLVNMFKDIEKIGVVEMSPDFENVRNPLIKIIEKTFDDYELKNKIKYKRS